MHNLNYGHKHAGSHPYRLAIRVGCALLLISSIAFTAAVGGPPVVVAGPVVIAAVVGFSGVLVITECHLLILDNYDISDLPEPSLSRAHSTHTASSDNQLPPPPKFQTSHPCISSGFAVMYAMCFCSAAMASGLAGPIMRGIGARKGLAIATTILGVLTVAFGAVLWRGKRKRRPVAQEEGAEEEAEETPGVSLFMRAWGSRWWENQGRGMWDDRERMRGVE